MDNPFYKIKNKISKILKSGFIPDTAPAQKPICEFCGDTGKVWVDYGQCTDKSCVAHRGYEDCDHCNVRSIRK